MPDAASTCFTAAKRRAFSSRRGFTLVELVVATLISAIVFAAIFSAYIFMARNLARLANSQTQFGQSRNVLQFFARDVGNASQVLTYQASAVALLLPSPSDPTITYTVTYTYDNAAQTLVRLESLSHTSVTLLSNLTTLTFRYYTRAGTETTTAINIKQIQLNYNTAVGSSDTGTRSQNTMVSSRVALRNKSSSGP
jgi:prepilin-type N-terminal cleavage/methylation domain-containing protein